jgi:imidazole glycerol-phosphate synthase subunit HisH
MGTAVRMLRGCGASGKPNAMIAIIDYRMGNVGSIANMLLHLGVEARITADPKELAAARGLILPGVGAFDRGMQNLTEAGLDRVLTEIVGGGKPLLGICLGMQLLGRRSEEGERPGLGWLAAESRRFRLDDQGLRVPHMRWNTIAPTGESALCRGIDGQSRFYFVHSYHVVCDDPRDVICETEYGVRFNACVQRGNLYGVQFHPEKSHRFGKQLLRNFVALCDAQGSRAA